MSRDLGSPERRKGPFVRFVCSGKIGSEQTNQKENMPTCLIIGQMLL